MFFIIIKYISINFFIFNELLSSLKYIINYRNNNSIININCNINYFNVFLNLNLIIFIFILKKI